MSILDDLLGGQQPTAPPPEPPAATPAALPQPETPAQENILDKLIAQGPAPIQDVGVSAAPTAGEIGEDIAKSAAIGVPKGLIAGAGTPGAIRELASTGTDYVGSLLGYTPEQISKFKEYAAQASKVSPAGRLFAVAPTPAEIRKAIEEKTGKFYEPKTGYGQIAEAGTEFLANPMSYLGPGSMGLKAATALGMGIGSESAGQVAEYYGGEGLPADAARFAGAVISGAVKLPQRVVNARFNRMLDGATSTDELLDTADSMYDLSRHSGVQLRTGVLREIATKAESDLLADGLNEVTAPGTVKTLNNVLLNLHNNLGNVGITELQTARRALSRVANTKSPDLAADREAARYAIAEINKYAASAPIKDLVVGTPQMLSEATQSWKMADKAYSAGMRAKQLEEALEKAITDTAKAGKGGNLENNMRKAVGDIANSKVKRRGFTDDEVDLMKEIARGTKGRNALRKLSALAPTGIVSGGIGLEIGHLLFSGAFHGLGAVIPGTVGAAAKRMAESRTERRIQDLISGVRLRGTNLTPPTRPEQAWMTPPLSTLYTAPGAVNPEQPTGFAHGGRVWHKKLDHKSVGYVARSRRQEHCAACNMFIAKGGPACSLVKSPINPAGWCRRFEKKQ